MKVIKVVMLSGTHGRKCEVPDDDILIHAGDLTMTGSYDQIAIQGDWIRRLPHKYKVVIAGNHDWLFERNQKRALEALGLGIHYLENSGVFLEGLHF